MGWLLLLPLILAAWLAVAIANWCVKKDGSWRILGILSSLAIGGISILVGYSFGIEGTTEFREDGIYTVTYPVLGWAGMIGGGLIAIIGTWTSLVGTKEEIELREEIEKREKELKKADLAEAKNTANAMLEKGKVENYERLHWIREVLSKEKYDFESIDLLEKLKKLEKASKRLT